MAKVVDWLATIGAKICHTGWSSLIGEKKHIIAYTENILYWQLKINKCKVPTKSVCQHMAFSSSFK